MRRVHRQSERPGRTLQTARRLAAVWALAAALVSATTAATAATAAPTCLDPAGETVRCDAPNALPVGVSPAPDPASRQETATVPLPAPETLFALVCILGGLFVLIGLMPDFDGWGPGEHEGRGKQD